MCLHVADRTPRRAGIRPRFIPALLTIVLMTVTANPGLAQNNAVGNTDAGAIAPNEAGATTLMQDTLPHPLAHEAGRVCSVYASLEDSLVECPLEQAGAPRSRYPSLTRSVGTEHPLEGARAAQRLPAMTPITLHLNTCEADTGSARAFAGQLRIVRLNVRNGQRHLVSRERNRYVQQDIQWPTATLPFTTEQAAPTLWMLRVEALPPGEYALLELGYTGNASGTLLVHTFGVDPEEEMPHNR